MTQYGALARHYEALNGTDGPRRWADCLERHFKKAAIPIKTVLDLACGTGSLSRELAGRGYEVIGVDLSEEMLAEASSKAAGMQNAPMFIRQDMSRLDLYGTVDAVVCCLDSVNYITDPRMLQRAFARVRLFLAPGGVFIFDINTPGKLKSMDGQCFSSESEDAFCVWRAFYRQKTGMATFVIDLFERRGDRWLRHAEQHRERAYSLDELEAMLEKAGFSSVKHFSGLTQKPAAVCDDRVFFRRL